VKIISLEEHSETYSKKKKNRIKLIKFKEKEDKLITDLIDFLKSENYEIKLDQIIGNFNFDIIATKADEIILVEIETAKTISPVLINSYAFIVEKYQKELNEKGEGNKYLNPILVYTGKIQPAAELIGKQVNLRFSKPDEFQQQFS